jgi:hypothetical protein
MSPGSLSLKENSTVAGPPLPLIIEPRCEVQLTVFGECLNGVMAFVQICERSLTGAQGGPTMPPVQSFVRAEMFPSGYLIRQCDGGGCIIHIVDHLDLEVGFRVSGL